MLKSTKSILYSKLQFLHFNYNKLCKLTQFSFDNQLIPYPVQYKSTTEDISNDVKPTENQNDDSINAEQKHVTSSIPSDISIKTDKLNFSPGLKKNA